jgi:PAS domain-containing protein
MFKMEDCSEMIKSLEPLKQNTVLAKELFGEEYELFEQCMNERNDESTEYCIMMKYFHNIYASMSEQKWMIHPDIIYVDKECNHLFGYSFETMGTNVFQTATCTRCKLKLMRFVGKNKTVFSLRVKQLTDDKPAWDNTKVIQKSTDVDKY